MKGPKPVCTSARKKMNQSSPCWLCGDGGGRTGTGSGTTLPLAGRLRRSSPSFAIKWNEFATRSQLPLVVEFPGLQTAGGAEHDHRLILLVFGRLAHLLLGQFQRDTVLLVFNGTEVERTPIDNDLAAADAEETTEIDHRGADHAVAVDDDVDDAAHVLVSRTTDLAAEDAMSVARPDHGDRGRWFRLFRRVRLRDILRGAASGRLTLCPYACGHGKSHGRESNQPSCTHMTLP